MTTEAEKTNDSAPTPAAWPLRLWGVRHIRAAVLTYRINKHYDDWAQIGFLAVYADRDWKIVDRVRSGDL